MHQRRLLCPCLRESAGDEALLQASTGTRRFQKVPKDLLLTPNYPEVATLETTWSSNLIFVSIQPR